MKFGVQPGATNQFILLLTFCVFQDQTTIVVGKYLLRKANHSISEPWF